MPGSIGISGIIILGVLMLLVFGPKRLPEMGRAMGHGMREFKDSITGSGDESPPEITHRVKRDHS